MDEGFTILIGTENPNDPVNAFELTYFLTNFRAIYVIAVEMEEKKSLSLDLDDAVKSLSKKLTGLEIYRFARKLLPVDLELEFDSISKNSPLRLRTCVGVSMMALSAAVVLSGGKANLKDGMFEVPSLASGIRDLENVFGKKNTLPLPSDSRKSSKVTAKIKK